MDGQKTGRGKEKKSLGESDSEVAILWVLNVGDCEALRRC